MSNKLKGLYLYVKGHAWSITPGLPYEGGEIRINAYRDVSFRFITKKIKP